VAAITKDHIFKILNQFRQLAKIAAAFQN